ncbi:MAG: 16S rRNA (cytidine(1402)-2'-O)-methyltransferase [Chloroflexi bacterium]|nr:16S rRNA (cytidine(1402)-2'-O)-methyltransferase [Chloroflexota bacterium]
MLYVVATPIGNLEDISLRAIRILKEVSLIAAEDTRKTRILLNKYEIQTPLTSYFEHNKITKLPRILGALEQEDVALVSEAGMPGISDPGYELVKAAIQLGITVVPIPGPSAVVTALSVAGLPANEFIYIGFLPREKKKKKKLLVSISEEPRTIVAFESPYRVLASLGAIRDVLGDRQIAVCRELTKLYEEIFRGTITEALEHFKKPKGEFTLVIEGVARKRKPLPESI